MGYSFRKTCYSDTITYLSTCKRSSTVRKQCISSPILANWKLKTNKYTFTTFPRPWTGDQVEAWFRAKEQNQSELFW